MKIKHKFYIKLNQRLSDKPLCIRINMIKKIMSDLDNLLDDPLEDDVDDFELDEELTENTFADDHNASMQERENRIKKWQEHYISKGIVEPNDNEDKSKNESNIRSLFGRTILHEAVLTGNLNIVKQSINENTDFNKKDNNEMTALELAIMEEYTDITNYLSNLANSGSISSNT